MKKNLIKKTKIMSLTLNQIRRIRKLNVKDGDIIMLPREYVSDYLIDMFGKMLKDVFPEKRIISIAASEFVIKGMKVINVKGAKNVKDRNVSSSEQQHSKDGVRRKKPNAEGTI